MVESPPYQVNRDINTVDNIGDNIVGTLLDKQHQKIDLEIIEVPGRQPPCIWENLTEEKKTQKNVNCFVLFR